MSFNEFAQVFGGLGLFLLGMSALTDGLKGAAGSTLREILSRFTRGRISALTTGLLFTAGVQSSSATTLAAIGFVNSGLLSLSQSVGVLYGANLGTTLTGWIISILGFKVKISAFALPAIGTGALFKLFGRGKLPAVGVGLAGFGMIFLGIDLMQAGMLNTGKTLGFEEFAANSLWGRLILVGIGALMTIVMQSSSAALAITLTAVAAGSIQLPEAAALAIGQNVGTTVTAILGSLGATANAKRTALAHVLFNVITAIVALIFFTPFLLLVNWSSHQLGFFDTPSLLAMFHTGFNVLGVLIMTPFINVQVKYLHQWIKDDKKVVGDPKYLAKDLIPYPELAMEAAEKEFRHLQEIVSSTLTRTVHPVQTESEARENLIRITESNQIVDKLVYAITNFSENIKRETPDITSRIFALLHLTEHLSLATQMALQAAQHRARFVTVPEKTKEDLSYLEQVVRQSAMQLVDQRISRETRAQILSHSQDLARSSRDEIRKKLYSSAAEAKITATLGLDLANYVNALERAVHHLFRAEYYWASHPVPDQQSSKRQVEFETPSDA